MLKLLICPSQMLWVCILFFISVISILFIRFVKAAPKVDTVNYQVKAGLDKNAQVADMTLQNAIGNLYLSYS